MKWMFWKKRSVPPVKDKTDKCKKHGEDLIYYGHFSRGTALREAYTLYASGNNCYICPACVAAAVQVDVVGRQKANEIMAQLDDLERAQWPDVVQGGVAPDQVPQMGQTMPERVGRGF